MFKPFLAVVLLCLCVYSQTSIKDFPDTVVMTTIPDKAVMITEATKPVYQFNVAVVVIDGEKIVCKTRAEYQNALKVYELVYRLKVARSESKMTPEQYVDTVSVLVSSLK